MVITQIDTEWQICTKKGSASVNKSLVLAWLMTVCIYPNHVYELFVTSNSASLADLA